MRINSREQHEIEMTKQGVTAFGKISDSAQTKGLLMLLELYKLETSKDERLSILAFMLAVETGEFPNLRYELNSFGREKPENPKG